MKTGIRIYNAAKLLWDTQNFDNEEEARAHARTIGTVRGQKTWTVEVRQEGRCIAKYRGGKEIRQAGHS